MTRQHLSQIPVRIKYHLFTFMLLEQSVEERVRLLIDDLKKLDRTYFGKDRVKQMKNKLDQAINLLDEKPIDMSKLNYPLIQI